MSAALLAALLCLPAAAQEGSVAEQSLGSVHALVSRTVREALEWSPDAKLYSILGAGPKDGVLFEEWTLVYGDPEARDGFYAVKFGDGILQERRFCKAGLNLREYYWDGKLRNSSKGKEGDSCGGAYYRTNLPLGSDFMDAPRLDSLLKARRFARPKGERFALELSRLTEPKVSEEFSQRFKAGFLLDGTYRVIGPIPANGRDKAMWIVDNMEESLFLDAATGKLVNKRPNVSRPGALGAEAWAVR